MKRPRIRERKTERLNVCITKENRDDLAVIAIREDRDLGYLAGWFVAWGIEQYKLLGESLVDLRARSGDQEGRFARNSLKRLALREEAQRANDQLPESFPERKRA